MIKNIYDRAISFFNEHNISVNLSRDMPAGYETAFGTYDIEKNTLFINDQFIGNVSEPEYLFIFIMNCGMRSNTFSRTSLMKR